MLGRFGDVPSSWTEYLNWVVLCVTMYYKVGVYVSEFELP